MKALVFLVTACLMVLGLNSVLATEVAKTERIMVRFSPQNIVAEPVIVDGEFVLYCDNGTITIPALSGAEHVEPGFRRGTSGYSLQGPWLVWIPKGEQEPETIAGLLELDPNILRVSTELKHEDNPVLGEENLRALPPHESSIQNRFFCDDTNGGDAFQRNLYMRMQDETAQDDDWCQLVEASTLMDHDMDCPQAWAITKGDTNIVVAVIDLGFEWTHEAMGGPGPINPLPTTTDSLAAYNDGVWFRNWNEEPGDANNDGYPGLQGIDDDGDGLTDEDSFLNEPGDQGEADVVWGYNSGYSANEIYDSTANFGDLVGMYMTADMKDHNTLTRMIIWNDATTIRTRDVNSSNYPNGWISVLDVGDLYRVGNGLNDDGDSLVDEIGYINDLVFDDDENSFPDDIRGWDFVDLDEEYNPTAHYDKGDYWDEDNDPRGLADHGTGVASFVATSWEYGKTLGVAPGVRVLPLRGGYYKKTHRECISRLSIAQAVHYAVDMGADILVLARGQASQVEADAINYAIDQGVIHINGAGNRFDSHNYFTRITGPNLLVAGLALNDAAWDETRYGEWVDVAARALNLVFPAPRHFWPGHKYAWTSGTSFSGPQVGGVAALVKSVYPHWTRDDILNKVVTSVDNIYMPPEEPNLNSAFAQGQLLGSGRVNAYRAITFYGQVGTIETDTTWTGNVYVSGDVTVPAGSSLSLEAGTKVYIGIDDILDAGESPTQCEFHIQGDFICNGTSSDPVVFELFKGEDDTDSTWGPIVFEGGGQGNTVELIHTHFLGLKNPLQKGDPEAAHRLDLTMDNCLIESKFSGISLLEMKNGDSFQMSNCQLNGEMTLSGMGLELQASSGQTDFTIDINQGNTIAGFGIGLSIPSGAIWNCSGISIQNCGMGVEVNHMGDGQVLGPNLTVTGSSGIGVYCTNGAVVLDGVEVTDSGQTGILVDDGCLLTIGSNGVHISSSGLHGLHLDGASNSSAVDRPVISGSVSSGIRLTNCSPSIMNAEIAGPGNAGVFFVNSNGTLNSSQISGVGSGVRVFDQSDPTVRSCDISNCFYGVFVGLDGQGDFGTASSYGMINFSNISVSYGVNWNSSYSLPFQYNCFDGTSTPPASEFGTKKTPFGITNGVILYSPGYCQ